MIKTRRKVSVPLPVVEFPGGAEAAQRRETEVTVVASAVFLAASCAAVTALVLWSGIGAFLAAVVAWLLLVVALFSVCPLYRKMGRVPPLITSSTSEIEDALVSAGVPEPVAADAAQQADTGHPPRTKMDRRLIDGGETVYRASAEVVGPRIVDVGGEPAKLEVTWEEKR